MAKTQTYGLFTDAAREREQSGNVAVLAERLRLDELTEEDQDALMDFALVLVDRRRHAIMLGFPLEELTPELIEELIREQEAKRKR